MRNVVWGASGTTGQRCTATSLVMVQQGVLREFNERLVAATERLRVGDGLDPAVDMGPLVNSGRADFVHAHTESGLHEGAFFKPTIFTGVSPTMRIAREEIFGLLLSLLPVSSYEEAARVANSTDYGLSTAIFPHDARITIRA